MIEKISLTIEKLNLSSGNVSRLEMLIITAFASTLNDGENFLEIGTFNGNTTINCALNMKKIQKYLQLIFLKMQKLKILIVKMSI